VKIGVLGGTFDPIHSGHTHIAREVARVLDLDQVVFMVAKSPPHKLSEEISSAFHRYAMVVLELMKEERFFVSTLELLRERPSYTVETMRELSLLYPDDQLCFIAGSDSLQELHLWYEYDKLLSRHSLVFVQRPGAEVDLEELEISSNLKDSIRLVEDEGVFDIQEGRSFCLSLDAPPVSSTEIRRLIASGKRPAGNIVSPQVDQYIRKYRLYE
jgi:nicotinate-nucleotide adenylyltransferase